MAEKIWLPIIVFASFAISKTKPKPSKTFVVNSCFFLLTWLGILSLIGKVATLGLATKAHNLLIGLIPSGLMSPSGVIGISFYFIVLDFLGYWHHRLMHTRFFWPLHSVHHSSTSFDNVAAFRDHPLNTPISTLTVALPIAVFFDNSSVTGFCVSIYLILVKLLNILQHSEGRWGFGLFHKIIVSPRLHRIHHSRIPKYYDCNFSQTFVIWDLLFKTYENSDEAFFGPIGFESSQNLNSLMLLPAKQFGCNAVELVKRVFHFSQPFDADSRQE